MQQPLGVDPLKLRMIGAIFWAGLLVYFVPSWFMHPVDFSPNISSLSKEKISAHDVETTTTTTQLAAAAVESAVQEQEKQNTLFIDKPLTVTPPQADPARVQSLNQSFSAREAELDVKGKVKVAKQATKFLGPAPTISTTGRFTLQIATYTAESVALATQARLQAAGFTGKLTVINYKTGKKGYQVRIGPYQSLADANRAKAIVDVRFHTNSVVLGK
jgi:cell division protein FtsN